MEIRDTEGRLLYSTEGVEAADFPGTDLSGAKLTDDDLTGVHLCLEGVDLSGADLSAYLEGDRPTPCEQDCMTRADTDADGARTPHGDDERR